MKHVACLMFVVALSSCVGSSTERNPLKRTSVASVVTQLEVESVEQHSNACLHWTERDWMLDENPYLTAEEKAIIKRVDAELDGL